MDKITKVELLDEQDNSLKLLVFKKFMFFYVYGLVGYDDENYSLHNLRLAAYFCWLVSYVLIIK